MINEKDILAMLQNGEKADDIAQKLVDVLNKGKTLYNEELAAKAKADEEAKAKAALDAEKQEDMTKVLDIVYQFVLKWYCDSDEDIKELDETYKAFTPKAVIEAIEEIGKFAIQLDNMKSMFEFTIPAVENVAVKRVPRPKKSADDTIAAFMKNLGL